jgi:hypothetical protein
MAKFQACDRAYALQYHHNIIPDLAVRYEHKRESRLQPINCFPGSIFHETIQSALMTQRSNGKLPPGLMEIAKQITADYIRFSREWVKDVRENPILGGFHPYWPDHPYAQPVESFYYDDFPANFKTTLREKLERWFERFLVLSPQLPFNTAPPASWLFPKEVSRKIPWFVHKDNFAVYSVFDFLTKEEDKITIYDWKTGKRTSGEAAVAEQLMTYAAYAISKWSVEPESIKLFAVWVEDGSIQEVECDAWEIQRMERKWEEQQQDWKSKLGQVNGDADRLFDLFPMTNDQRTCARCAFRSCPGRQRTPAQLLAEARTIDFSDE